MADNELVPSRFVISAYDSILYLLYVGAHQYFTDESAFRPILFKSNEIEKELVPGLWCVKTKYQSDRFKATAQVLETIEALIQDDAECLFEDTTAA